MNNSTRDQWTGVWLARNRATGFVYERRYRVASNPAQEANHSKPVTRNERDQCQDQGHERDRCGAFNRMADRRFRHKESDHRSGCQAGGSWVFQSVAHAQILGEGNDERRGEAGPQNCRNHGAQAWSPGVPFEQDDGPRQQRDHQARLRVPARKDKEGRANESQEGASCWPPDETANAREKQTGLGQPRACGGARATRRTARRARTRPHRANGNPRPSEVTKPDERSRCRQEDAQQE